jgi:hypothetical protein
VIQQTLLKFEHVADRKPKILTTMKHDAHASTIETQLRSLLQRTARFPLEVPFEESVPKRGCFLNLRADIIQTLLGNS